VEAVTWLAVVSKSAFVLQRHPKSRMNILHRFDVAEGVREHEAPFTLGHSDCHCFSVLTTIGAMGMSRFPALVFIGPILPQPSARCRIWIWPFSRSTPSQDSPRSSLKRMPVNIAVTMNGLQRPAEFSMSLLSSPIVGKSTPARNGPVSASRLSTLMRTPLTTFWATSPRPWANVSMVSGS
jgi:hypothetical protein